jgi:NAD(P)-dependent dehydrogenase (short-subunit alcohol dehydrogenase family)
MSSSAYHRLDERIIVVTGAARGIGAAIARYIRDLGATPVMVDRSEGVLQAATDLGAPGIVLDITDSTALDAAARSVVEQHGRVDGLVVNAGVAADGPAIDTTDEEWRRVLSVNLDGAFYTIRAFGRPMLASRRGSIVAISSAAGVKVGRPERHLVYDVSKAGVAHMCKSLGVEWGATGVRVNAVGPAYTDTDMLAEVGRAQPETMRVWLDSIPMRRLMDPREIASTVAFLLSDASSGMTGQFLLVDGGWTLC